jgi:hypothetical protein
MRAALFLRSCLTATGIALLGTSWISCNNGSNGAGSEDAGEDVVDALNPGDSTIQDVFSCDPCDEVCSCSVGETLGGNCGTLFCPTSGMWGGKNFCESNCEDASDDGPTCDPCVSACTCLLGFPPRDDPSTCSTVICKGTGDPTYGTWGPGVFCPTTRVCDGGIDAANESGADVIPDVMSEAASD